MNQQTATKTRLPWEDRWSEPELNQLVKPIDDQPRRAFSTLISNIDGLERVGRALTWYGPAWKWTIEYQLLGQNGEAVQVLAYLVPRNSGPLVCVPLTNNVIGHLPMRRLNKFFRNGIRSAKCAVEIQWAVWNLSASTEVIHLMDLIKRKHKILLGLPSRSKGSKK